MQKVVSLLLELLKVWEVYSTVEGHWKGGLPPWPQGVRSVGA